MAQNSALLALDIPICRYRGDTRTLVYHFTDSAGNDVDISARTYRLTVNVLEDPGPSDTPEFTIVGAFVTDGTDGRIGFTLSPAEADRVGEFFYDVEETAGGQPLTKIKSNWDFLQDISK